MNKSLLKLCPRCRGHKKIKNIGWVDVDCTKCDGIGKVSNYEDDAIIPIAIEKPIVTFVKPISKLPEKANKKESLTDV